MAYDEGLSYNKGYRKALETVVETLHLASAENPEAGVAVNRIVQLLVENATANVKLMFNTWRPRWLNSNSRLRKSESSTG